MTIALEKSLHDFNPDHFGGLNEFLSTSDTVERDTLMIACADHGSAPDNVSFAGTERFFILQHIAECVPPPDGCETNDLFGAIEVGFQNYDLRQVVVCGHLGCGVIPKWLKDSTGRDTGNLRANFYSAAVRAVDTTYPELTGQSYVERLICEHAIFQLENLQANPFIRKKLDANKLKLHLWIVNDETARVLAFDPRKGDLVPIEEMR